MKIFIVGENHATDKPERIEVERLENTSSILVATEFKHYLGDDFAYHHGLEDLIVEFTLDCACAIFNIVPHTYSINPAFGRDSIVGRWKETKEKLDDKFSFKLYENVYDPIYGSGTVNLIKYYIPFLINAFSHNPQQYNQVIKWLTAAVECFLKIIFDKYKGFPLPPFQVEDYSSLNDEKKFTLRQYFYETLRDSIFSCHIKTLTQEAERQGKDFAIFLIGRSHLPGIKQRIENNGNWAKYIVYCNNYEQFNTFYAQSEKNMQPSISKYTYNLDPFGKSRVAIHLDAFDNSSKKRSYSR